MTADQADHATEIKETDIVFDCPHCGKSLAIDYRGAGLTIPCTDCGKKCVVPIPEGMQIDDIDSSAEEQEMRILNLRRSLATAEVRLAEMDAEIEELRTRRKTLEATRAHNIKRFGFIMEKTEVIRNALKEISTAMARITESLEQETKRDSTGEG